MLKTNKFISRLSNFLFIQINELKFFLNIDFYRYLYFLKKIQDKKKIKKNIFIFDNFQDINGSFFRIIYLIIISNFYNAQLYHFGIKYSILFRFLYWIAGSKKILINRSKSQENKLSKEISSFFKKVKNKQDILDYKINGFNIGLDIYESYLIRNKEPTIFNISKSNNNLKKTVVEAICTIFFWENYLKKNKNLIKGVLLSHRNYVETNILNRISIKNKIKVFTTSGEMHSLHRWKNLSLNFFTYYNLFFNSLSVNVKKNAINWSKSRLKKRFDGQVGVDMDYSKKSAFNKSNNSFNNFSKIENNNKIKILICTSCFFDNPHCYGKMMFVDFYEKLKFLGQISHEVDYDWYIKPHPDFLPGTIEILEKSLKFFKKCKIIDPSTSFHDIKNVINCAITTYGTIGHELPLLGIPVINCSKINPHMEFKFNYTPKSKKDLKKIIKNGNFKITDEKSIYRFYYIHHHFLSVSNLFSKKKISSLNSSKNSFKEKLNFLKYDANIEIIKKKIIFFLKHDNFKTVDKNYLKILASVRDVNFQ